MKLHLVQVCNVGEICGGTAACAWSITQAFPDWQHTVLFPGVATGETAKAFAHCRVLSREVLARDGWKAIGGDVVILHNVSPGALSDVPHGLTLSYHHSAGTRAAGNLHAACSQWLAEQQDRSLPVLYQPVPRPLNRSPTGNRALDDELTVGRLCTPQPRKWPPEMADRYRYWAGCFPSLRWEFVGCPQPLQPKLTAACGGRCRFLSPGHQARGHLQRWHAMLYHHPSLTESFGRTVAEALRAGCIPIVDDRGGFREQIHSGIDGFLCRDTADFEAALGTIHDPAIRWQIAGAARRQGDEHFSLRAFRARFLDFLLAGDVRPES